MSQLKPHSPSIYKVAAGIWAKSFEDGNNSTAESTEASTHPYALVNVEQVLPSREQMEVFETRRNQLDRLIPAGKKLETVNCFFNPSSEGQLKKILQVGWKEGLQNILHDIVFYSNALSAIKANNVPYHKVFVVRVCLGREGIDYQSTGKPIGYKIQDLNGVMSSYLLTYRNTLLPAESTPPSSPFKSSTDNVSSPTKSPASPSNLKTSSSSVSPARTSGSLQGDGKLCPSCSRENAGNTRYCVRCGSHL
eukprot:gene2858-3551_t